MVFKGRLLAEDRALARFLKLDGKMSLRKIGKLCHMSPMSVKRCTQSELKTPTSHTSKTTHGSRVGSKHKASRPGRPRKLSMRTERHLIRELLKLRQREGSFSVSRLMTVAGISKTDFSVRTISNAIGRHGYECLQARKKGLLTPDDLKKRVKFARKMIRRPADFWCTDVAFYLDGVSFVYKTNPQDQGRAPKSRIYRKRSEGLSRSCTAKGKKEGTGGRYAKFVVAISHGKGVLVCERYDHMNGEYFASFIDRTFEHIFEDADKESNVFVQDGDASQNSAAARQAMGRVRAQLLSIPARSPDLNPIENFFHTVSKTLKEEAVSTNLSRETYEEFENRIIRTMFAVPIDEISKTIASIPKRLGLIIKSRGERTKY